MITWLERNQLMHLYCQLVSPKCIFGKILCSANIAIGNCKVKISLHTMHILN